MLGALEGGWVAPEAGGDLLRDGPGVLPTGKAQYCMPGPAEQHRVRGAAAGQAVISLHTVFALCGCGLKSLVNSTHLPSCQPH
jgi:hypothetical protein